MLNVLIQLDPGAIMPTNDKLGNVFINNEESDNAGYDLYAYENCVIAPGERAVIKTGVHIRTDPGHYIAVKGRSGMAVKQGVAVLAGTVDSACYTGDVSAVLLNTDKNQAVWIEKGDRIAQMVFLRYDTVRFNVVDKLPESKRNDSGFGSSGQ